MECSSIMTASSNPLIAFSDQAAGLVERAGRSVVSVHGGGRHPISGIVWRPGVVVTAEESLERDDEITVALPGGRQVAAKLAGRDPSTDVAALRIEAPDAPAIATSDAAALRVGQVVLTVGGYEGAPVASLGTVSYIGGAWQSSRGGAIDSFLRLDLGLAPSAEGAAVVDAHGAVIGMAVLGPRRRVLAIPGSTIDRTLDQLLAKGHVARGYLGAGLQPIRPGRRGKTAGSAIEHGVLVVSVDPDGPAASAGVLVGDVVTAWNAKPIGRVREVVRLLGANSVGGTVKLDVLRGGATQNLEVVIGERPLE
jgi:S1-C subfamily serine protease